MEMMFQPPNNIYQEMILNKALKERTIVLNDYVDVETMYQIAYHMDRIKSIDDNQNIPMEKRKPITITISSGGGSCYDGLFIISKIETFKNMGYVIIIRTEAMACSMAFMMLCVGSIRQMYRRSKIMFHQPSQYEFGYSKMQDKEDNVEELRAIWDEIKDICIEYTGLTNEYMEQIKREKLDRWFSSEEALIYGIIDEII